MSVVINPYRFNSVGARSFEISPAVEGKTTWDLDDDGPMVLDAAGEWTFTPNAGFFGTVSIWGGGGGNGSLAANDGDATTFAGLTANGGNRGAPSGNGGGTASGGTTNTTGNAGQNQSNGTGGRGGGAGNGGGNVSGGGIGQFAAEASVPGGGGPGHGDVDGLGGGGAGAGGGGYSTRAYALEELTVGSPITITVGDGGPSANTGLSGGRPGKPGRFRVE